jgi:2-oxoglutarate ferredoxin oxidoreductase subunit alpha
MDRDSIPPPIAQAFASIEKGGYLFYDFDQAPPRLALRDDITVIGVPLTAICNREYIDPRQRQLFKNIIYVGRSRRCSTWTSARSRS